MTFLDPHGGLHHAAGIVRRNEAGELVVVESWADDVRQETAVPRDANVERSARRDNRRFPCFRVV